MEKMRLSNSNFGTIVTDMLQPPDDSEIDRVFFDPNVSNIWLVTT